MANGGNKPKPAFFLAAAISVAPSVTVRDPKRSVISGPSGYPTVKDRSRDMQTMVAKAISGGCEGVLHIDADPAYAATRG